MKSELELGSIKKDFEALDFSDAEMFFGSSSSEEFVQISFSRTTHLVFYVKISLEFTLWGLTIRTLDREGEMPAWETERRVDHSQWEELVVFNLKNFAVAEGEIKKHGVDTILENVKRFCGIDTWLNLGQTWVLAQDHTVFSLYNSQNTPMPITMGVKIRESISWCAVNVVQSEKLTLEAVFYKEIVIFSISNKLIELDV